MSNISISTTKLYDFLLTTHPPLIIDVRKKQAFDADPHILPGASWCALEELQNRAKKASRSQSIIVYYIHGHEVSQDACMSLRELGFDARYLEGGITGWKQAGLPIDGKIK